MYNVNYAGLEMKCDPEKFELSVLLNGKTKRFCGIPKILITREGPSVSLATGKCESKEIHTGTGRGVRAVYSGMKIPEGHEDCSGITVTIDTVILHDGTLSYTADVRNEPQSGIYAIDLQYIAFGEEAGKGYTVLPRMQGILLDACSSDTINDGIFAGLIYQRDAYMPVMGQITGTDKPYGKGFGYAMIYDTPDDAYYIFEHKPGGDTLITPRFNESLGNIRYKRKLIYIFDEEMDFVKMAAFYRKYLEERGKIVTLREKIARNPNVEYILDAPIIHTDIAINISKETPAYNWEHPEVNDRWVPFDKRAQQLEKLKKNGLEKAYIHLDGWGRDGYDSMHPDVFPPHERAGGAEGMKRLADKCRELGYVFGIHDQYRDYYANADSFDADNAVRNADGSNTYYCVWCGGKQTFLCESFALEYVKRNYAEFEKLGIDVRGSYLDVFSVVEEDECFHPDHLMTRKECAKYRQQCFSFLTSKGIIASSEETVDNIVPYIDLCHHAPYFVDDICNKSHLAGVPVPLFNLVWHDCIVTPWFTIWDNGFGFPDNYDILGLAYMNGGNVYWPIDGVSPEDEKTLRDGLDFFRKVGKSRLVNHELIDGNPRKRKSVFASEDGKTVTVYVDFDAEKDKMIKIEY